MKLDDTYLYGIAADSNSEWRDNLRYDISAYENQWVQVSFTIGGISGTQTGKLFVNGELVKEHTGTAAYWVYPFLIGNGYSSSYEGEFSGQIDDVRIYNRALSEDEVKYLYETTQGNYE
jgi:hypothetical protein